MSDKEEFNINEVSKIVGVAPHIIRYWESEFIQLKPMKDESRQKSYTRNDLNVIVRIYELLFSGCTIANTKITLEKEFD